MIEQRIMDFYGRFFRLGWILHSLKKQGRDTEAGILEKIEDIKIVGEGAEPSPMQIVYNNLKYILTGNEPDFVRIDVAHLNGTRNLTMEFWRNGVRKQVYTEPTDKTREDLSKAVLNLRGYYGQRIGFSG